MNDNIVMPGDAVDAADNALAAISKIEGFDDLLPHLGHFLMATLQRVAFRFENAEDELERIADLNALHLFVDGVLTEHVRVCRELLGYSWTDIGKQLQVSRQAARQRFTFANRPDSDRFEAEEDYLLAKMKLDAARHALDNPDKAASVSIDGADLERLLEIWRERRALSQAALESATDDQITDIVTREDEL
ncbi:MAG: hypothetical protein KDA95_00480 [Acidimicrobiales bacterium]|nr:hypothetical protein [Acidimicrobiales bacterium]